MARVLSTKRLAVVQRYSKRLKALQEKGFDVEPLKAEIKKIKGVKITKKGISISESVYKSESDAIIHGLENSIKTVRLIKKDRQKAKKEEEKAAKRAVREAKRAEREKKKRAAAEKRALREAIREAEKEKRLTKLEKTLTKRVNDIMKKYDLEDYDIDKADVAKIFSQVDGVSVSEDGTISILDKKNFSYDREQALKKMLPTISSLEKEAKNDVMETFNMSEEDYEKNIKEDYHGLYKNITKKKLVENIKSRVKDNPFQKYYEVFEPGTDGAVAEMYQNDDREDPLKYDKAFEKLRELGRIYREEKMSDSFLNTQRDLDKQMRKIKGR